MMRAVGIRELKNKLSEYIRLVEAGESVLVTDRGTVVAELRSAGSTTQAPVEPALEPLAALFRSGQAVPGGPHQADLYAPQERLLPEGRLGQLLDEERSEA